MSSVISIMAKGHMLAFLDGFVVVFVPRGKPIQPSVEDTVGNTASTPIEEVSEAENFCWNFLHLKHLRETS